MRLSKDEIQLDCLDELRSAKWFLLREKQRHIDDIEQIDKDLARLTNVDLPERLIDILDHHFNIPPKKQQTLFEKYKKG
jgi:hypothetical protein